MPRTHGDEASGLAWPLSELLSGRAPLAGWQWGDPLHARRIELETVSIVDRAAGSSASIDFLAADDLSLARYDASYNGLFPFAALTARALAALSMRRLEQRNVLLTIPGSSETLALGSVVVDSYDRGFMASIVMAGLALEGEGDNRVTPQ